MRIRPPPGNGSGRSEEFPAVRTRDEGRGVVTAVTVSKLLPIGKVSVGEFPLGGAALGLRNLWLLRKWNVRRHHLLGGVAVRDRLSKELQLCMLSVGS